MENATKALIIAGSVLIAILLISVGIMVFNASNEPINQAQSSSEQQAVQMFNEVFTPYLGENITAQQAKSLISTVNASNSKNPDHQVTLDASGVTKVSSIKSTSHYSAVEGDYENGYIKTITITEKSGS